ncbi:MAG: single-stranded DNA-binding protein, partial [Clostridia bacterium]|nr:single-stranded DNA-binding protein [Clostridia bacterium]
MAFNRVILVGNLVADPELKTTPNGTSVIRFRIAVNRRFTRAGEQPQTDFFDITAWRQTAEFVARFFSKGRPILISGSLQNRN